MVFKTDADAAIVVDGSADSLVEALVAGGEWRLTEQVDYVAGKRIRFLERRASL